MSSKNDILFLLSGGSLNQSSSRSIGGLPSTFKIKDGLDNLFPDITLDQQKNGLQDFRCFYINNNTQNVINNLKIWIDRENNGARIDLGANLQKDTQFLFVDDKHPQGSFFLTYTTEINNVTIEENTKDIEWTDGKSVSKVIETELNQLTGLTGVKCTQKASSKDHSFTIVFPKGRSQALLKSGGDLKMEITRLLTGGPTNTIAPNIGSPNTPPVNVIFNSHLKGQPLNIGNFLPTDISPIWIRRIFDRTTKVGSNPDKFNINLSGDVT